MAKVTRVFAKKEDIPAGMESYYVEGEDGTWVLEGVDGEEDNGALKRAKDHEKNKRKEAEQKARDLESQVSDLREQLEDLEAGGGSKAEVSKLQRNLDKVTKQLADATQAAADSDSAWRGKFEKKFLDSHIRALASELSDSPDLLAPLLRDSFGVDFDGDEPSIRVRKDGEFTDVTMDQFTKSIKDDVKYAPLLKGSSASGGSADPSKKGQPGKTQKPDLMTASPKEIAAWVKANETSEE